MGPPLKVPFGFGLHNAHAWSQVSLAGPRTTTVTILVWNTVYFLCRVSFGRIITFFFFFRFALARTSNDTRIKK